MVRNLDANSEVLFLRGSYKIIYKDFNTTLHSFFSQNILSSPIDTIVTYTNRDITVIESFCSVLRHKLRTNIQHINNTTRHFLSVTERPLTSKKPLSKGEGRRGMSGGGEGLGVRSSPSCLHIKIELCCFFQYARQKCIFFHLALAENIYVGSKKIIVAYGTNHNQNGINLFSFPLCICCAHAPFQTPRHCLR